MFSRFKICLFLMIGFSFVKSSHAQWKKIYTAYSNDLYDVKQLGSKSYICGQGSMVLSSSDSGKSWKKLTLSIPSNLRTLYMLDTATVIVSGENARIQKTTDGGKTWSQKYVRTAAYAYDITFKGNDGLLVGKDMLIVSSQNAGESWAVDTTPQVRKQLNSVCITPSGICWAVGDSGFILKKKLSDKKWNKINSGTSIDLKSVNCIGDSIVFICGGMPDTSQIGKFYNILLYSSDSGKNWISTAVAEMKAISHSVFYSGDSGFMIGSNGIISKIYHPITKRSQQLSGTANTFNRISYVSENGIIVGDGGTILRSTNRGGWGLGIAFKQSMPEINLFPNPGDGKFSIETDQMIQEIRIYDSLGKSINYKQIDENYHLPEGYKGRAYVVIRLSDDREYVTVIEVL